MNLNHLLERRKNDRFIAIKENDKVITYSEWYYSSIEVSKVIIQHTSFCARNVAILLPNSIEYAVAYFGVLFAGKVIIPIDVKAKCPEIFATLKYCEVDLLITTSDLLNKLKLEVTLYSNRIDIYCINDNSIISINTDKKYVEKSFIPVFTNTEDDVAIMLHTSGTTSDPKRVMLTHKNLINNVESNISALKLSKADKGLIILPMCFGYCNTAQFLSYLYLGAQMHLFTGLFMPKRVFEIIQNEQITNMTMVPSMLLMLLESNYKYVYSLESLKYICFGGSRMPEDKLIMFMQNFPTVKMIHTYGQTEASPRTTMLDPEYAKEKVGSIGKPLPNVYVKVVNKEGVEVKSGAVGEIVVSGANVMKGYFKKDELTRQTIKNGWLHTGDLGYVDEDGFFYILGREKNIIISGGINIYPEEIEEILLNFNGVNDVCVVAEDHQILGEVPVAKIVPDNEMNLDLNEVKKYCKQKLADYKIPYKFIIVSEIIKTYNGKTKRSEAANDE